MTANLLTKYEDYKRPNITYTDTLRKSDIIELLHDFERVEDVTSISIGSYVSYIDIGVNPPLFRLGGTVIVSEPDYFVVSSGKVGFSVQKKDKIFFKRLTYKELKKELDTYLIKYKQIIEEKNTQIAQLMSYIKKLEKRLT